ncbi:MAG: hypothetical protein AB7J35_00265 [Dehalococcoidia bacterium]
MNSIGWEVFNFAFWLGGLAAVAFYWPRGVIGGRFVAIMFALGVALCVVDLVTYQARDGLPFVPLWWAITLFAFRGPRILTPPSPPEVGPASRAFQKH